ncbi:hypothetical protein [Desulfomonile tiedjei]|uniref:Uncharacterized protein n=1 Tax=Desulfomonile tiedjei (strain ATCC 49306 / DSM 6799 / DCB-1) TaxID=706587 RepID=I4C1C0_DESTA|nr:hypothetical protein [Desulfomonile tiedjei]AFM23361.1 hypothetical protein Desti_0635 [Desulfomonile tiedjei DSM 6799]
MSIRFLEWILLAPFLALLLLGNGYGREWRDPPGVQPEQMWSRVAYDPKLSDPFFESEEWSYWEGSRENPESGRFPPGKVPSKLKHTARCVSTSFGAKHEVRFCEAKLRDVDMIDLFIHENNPAFFDNLRVQIKNGMFTSQFWTLYKAGPRKGLTWTTKRQKLTLDKKAYQKGDVIKGRIDIEILDELIHPQYPDRPPRFIQLYGVFKTVLQ